MELSATNNMLTVTLILSTRKTAKPLAKPASAPCSVKAINLANHQKEQQTFRTEAKPCPPNPNKKILKPKPKTTPSYS
jgi:hypothetical protein